MVTAAVAVKSQWPSAVIAYDFNGRSVLALEPLNANLLPKGWHALSSNIKCHIESRSSLLVLPPQKNQLLKAFFFLLNIFLSFSRTKIRSWHLF